MASSQTNATQDIKTILRNWFDHDPQATLAEYLNLPESSPTPTGIRSQVEELLWKLSSRLDIALLKVWKSTNAKYEQFDDWYSNRFKESK